jgi:hypothetical protein
MPFIGVFIQQRRPLHSAGWFCAAASFCNVLPRTVWAIVFRHEFLMKKGPQNNLRPYITTAEFVVTQV